MLDYTTTVTDTWLICRPLHSFASVQMVSWWRGCQTCVVTDVLSSCLAVPSLSRPWTTCGILTQAVPQLHFSSSSRPPLRAHSGPPGALRPAMTTVASQTLAFTSYTCAVDLLSLKAPTVVQQVAGLAPPVGCRWSLACLRLPHLPPLLYSHHTSRHLAACCTLLPSSIPALSHSEGEKPKLFVVRSLLRSVLVFTPGLKKPRQKVHLLDFVKEDCGPSTCVGVWLSVWTLFSNWDTWTLHLFFMEWQELITTSRCWSCDK